MILSREMNKLVVLERIFDSLKTLSRFVDVNSFRN